LGTAGTPGATFKFTIVNAGTTIPSTEIFRINGITWDTDGSGSLKESVIYYDPAAYGTENPTSLIATDLRSRFFDIKSTSCILSIYWKFIHYAYASY